MASSSEGRRLRVGVVGTGFGARVHLPAFQRSEDFEVAAVVSGHQERAEQAARAAGIDWASDKYDAMLDEVELDAVSIATPGSLHHGMVLAAAERGLHILCEKPFAASLQEAQAMRDALQSAGVRGAINHEFRMIPARQRFKELVDQGVLGTPFDIRAITDLSMLLDRSRPWSWWSDRAQSGGMLQAIASHLIDFLLWTFGPIQSLSAQLDTFITERPTPDGGRRRVTSDDQDAALLRFASGAAGFLHTSGLYRAPRSVVEAHGSDGALLIEDNRLLCATEVGRFEPVELPPPAASGGGGQAGEPTIPLMAAYLRHVARTFRGEDDPMVATFEQGVRVQAVMDALHASSDQGGARIVIGT